MITNKYCRAFVVMITVAALLGCNQQDQLTKPEPIAEPEPIDEEFTQQLQKSLDRQLTELSQLQTNNEEQDQTASLEQLTEQDRVSLIDETAEEGSEKVKQDADKIIEILEDIAAENE